MLLLPSVPGSRGAEEAPAGWETASRACADAVEQGFARLESGDAAGARRDAEAALAVDASCGYGELLAARAEWAADDLKAALARLERLAVPALGLSPAAVRRSQALAAMELVRCHRELGAESEAQSWALVAWRLDPANRLDTWREALPAVWSAPGSTGAMLLAGQRPPGPVAMPWDAEGRLAAPVAGNGGERGPPVAFPTTVSTRPPQVSARPDWEGGAPGEPLSAILPGVAPDSVWCFFLARPEAAIIARSPAGRRRIPHSAPLPVTAAIAVEEDVFAAHPELPLLTQIAADGRTRGTWPIRRPATGLAYCPSTRFLFYTGDGFLWLLDLETGENLATGVPADRILLNPRTRRVTAYAAAVGEADLRSGANPWAGITTPWPLPKEGYPWTGISTVSWYSPWGRLLPVASGHGEAGRILGLDSDSLGRRASPQAWGGYRPPAAADPARPFLAALDGFGAGRGLQPGGQGTPLSPLAAQALLWTGESAPHRSAAEVFPTAVVVHSRDRANAGTEPFPGHYGFQAAWSPDGQLLVAARHAVGEYATSRGIGEGVACFELKPKSFDTEHARAAEALGRLTPAPNPEALAARRAEWGKRLEATGAPRPAAEADARRRLLAALARRPSVTPPAWTDAPAHGAADPLARLEADRLLQRAGSPDAGPWLHRAGLLARAHPDWAPALAARGWLRLGAGDTEGAEPDLRAALRADQGATDLSPLACLGLARLESRRGRVDEEWRWLAAGLEHDPGHAPTLEAAREALRRMDLHPPRPGGHPIPTPAAPPAAAGLAAGEDPLSRACNSAVMVQAKGAGTPMVGVLISREGHVLAPLLGVQPGFNEVEVAFLVAAGNGITVRERVAGRCERVDTRRGLALVRVARVPNGCSAPALDTRPAVPGEAVHLFAQPRADSPFHECGLQAGRVETGPLSWQGAGMFRHSAPAPTRIVYASGASPRKGTYVKGSAALYSDSGALRGFAAPSIDCDFDQIALSSDWLARWIRETHTE